MATGLEAYNALKNATKGLPVDSEFKVTDNQAKDLRKLTVSDLVSAGVDEALAKEAVDGLRKGNPDFLGECMRLRLTFE